VANGGPSPRTRSIALRISYVLAAVGFVGYWGAIWVLAATARIAEANGRTLSGEDAQVRAGIVVVLAMVAHAVGFGLAFRAPRGQRLLPAFLNGISLALQILIIAVGWRFGGGAR